MNPFMSIYLALKKCTMEMLNKNRRFTQAHKALGGQPVQDEPSFLSPADVDFVEVHLSSTIAMQIKDLEKNLYILATTVSLAPFLGLLGTVWGILTTFSELQMGAAGNSNQLVIGGLSLALATTVLGLLDAIPALIGYNYLKSTIRDFETDMQKFSTEVLASVELQYRRVDVS
jgi:biopolymer transport protein TolQ